MKIFPPVLRSTRAIVRPLIEFVYPAACFACERHLTDSDSCICSECWTSIKPVRREDPLYGEMRSRLVVEGYVVDVASAFYFEKEGTLQNLIHQLKYEEMTAIGVELGKRVAVGLATLFDAIPKGGIIPIPLHPAKERERGYNQSVYIARGIQSATGLPVQSDVVRRKKNTKTQTLLNREERLANVHEAFEVDGHASVRDDSIILVDDVITTGATILECARVLKQHGAGRVYAASVALADYGVDGAA